VIKQASTVGFPEKCDNIRKEGSSVSGKEVKVFRSVAEIGRDALDSISNDGFFTYEWFRTLETQQSFQVSPLYVAVYDEGKLVAVAPCFADLFDDYFLFAFAKITCCFVIRHFVVAARFCSRRVSRRSLF
jgi:hypothetical protein